ncbi:MAG: hypothetical protein AAGD25_14490 [Cyanobacteria bacterium P01_F01_bin.150]
MTIEQQVTLLTRDTNRTAAELEILRADMNARFDAVDQRFDAVDQRFDAVDQRFDAVDQRFDAVDQRLDRLEERFDRIETDVRQVIELLQNKA